MKDNNDKLEFTVQIAEKWCACLRDNKLDAIIFDSMVSPPMFSPEKLPLVAAYDLWVDLQDEYLDIQLTIFELDLAKY